MCPFSRENQVKTKFSWVFIQSVLISFNKEEVNTCKTLVTTNCPETLATFFVLRLCAAHMIQAVCKGILKTTKDKEQLEFGECVCDILVRETKCVCGCRNHRVSSAHTKTQNARWYWHGPVFEHWGRCKSVWIHHHKILFQHRILPGVDGDPQIHSGKQWGGRKRR